MRSRTLVFLLLTCLTLTGFAQTDYHPLKVGTQPGETKKPVKPAVWSIPSGMASQLGPDQPLIGWGIRAPKSFVSTQKEDGGNQVYIFQGDTRPDGSAPLFWVVTGIAKTAGGRIEPGLIMDFYMIQLHQNRENWKESPTQYGTIQGRSFLRRQWSGTQTVQGTLHPMHGTVYLTIADKKFACVTIQDNGVTATPTFHLMEAAAFSFHKK